LQPSKELFSDFFWAAASQLAGCSGMKKKMLPEQIVQAA